MFFKNKLFVLLFVLFLLQAIVNVIGTLGPETAFDALWYHLTLPKMYLLHHAIIHIPGGLLYYSDMPKLVEMLYVGSLTIGNETLAKLIQFSFGILCSFALYKLSRKFFNRTTSLIAVVIFYSNLVVDWESITAYVDLARTFFELLSLWSFVTWVETKNTKWFLISACMIGFAITTKLLAIGSLGIFIILIIYIEFTKCFGKAYKPFPAYERMILKVLVFVSIALFVPMPWMIFASIHTGNPVYPFFSSIYTVHPGNIFNVGNLLFSLWNVFTHAADPVSPVYLMFLPLVLFILRGNFPPHPTSWTLLKERKKTSTASFNLIISYAILSLFIWYLTPNTGGGRFILPYLPVYSLITASVFSYLFPSWFKKLLIGIVILLSITSILYRGVANAKYIPVVLGREGKQQFLTKHLNFSFGDFYDTDNYFKEHIKPTDYVLLYGFHNLYYVEFPFIDSSWTAHGDKFNYIAAQHGTIPAQYKNWRLVYQNSRTGVRLYKEKNNIWARY